MVETVGNQNRINRAVADRIGEAGTITAATSPASTDIPAGIGHVEITSAAAADGVRLTNISPGFTITGFVGLNGCKVRATGVGVATGKINNVDCSGAAAAGSLPANTFFRATMTSNGWVLSGTSAVGAAVAVVPA